MEKQLLEFHKLKNYLNEVYAIFFVGDAIDFCYTKDMCFAKLKDGFETVSYTHLDVYKRQPLYHA